MSSNEWAAAADPAYECCTFRGGVTALDARDRQSRLALVHDPAGTRRNRREKLVPARFGAIRPAHRSGTRRPSMSSGAGSTSARAKATRRPPPPQTDSVIAYDLDTGRMLWWHQSLPNDAWNMACFIGGGPNCPRENGPDLDIGAPPILHRLPSGDDVLLVGQKSADVFALDPDDGKLLWKVKYGRGGYAGGVHWGMAATPSLLYAPNADTTFLATEKGVAKPGLFALTPRDGSIEWFAPAPDVCPADLKPACDRGLFGAADGDSRRGVPAGVRRLAARVRAKATASCSGSSTPCANSTPSRAKRPAAARSRAPARSSRTAACW